MSWIWQFLKSTPLVLQVFIAAAIMALWPSWFVDVMVVVVAIMVYGRHGIGPPDVPQDARKNSHKPNNGDNYCLDN